MAAFMTEGVWVIEPDKHMPYHDRRFSNVVLQTIHYTQPVGYINLGDMLDCPQVSTHEKDPRKMIRLEEEIAQGNAYLDDIEGALPAGSDVHLLCGNHENRLLRYGIRNAPEVLALMPGWADLYDLTARQARRKARWFHHPYEKWDSLRLGNTVVHHGYYYDKHCAATNLLRYRGVNFVQGHTHRVAYSTNRDNWSAMLGHGSQEKLTAHTPTPGDHDMAVGILTVYKGKGEIEIYRYRNGQAIVRGRLIKG